MAPLKPSSALLFGAALGSTAGECARKSSSAPRRPRILVVGAGPTGIEAAVSCSLAGLGVTLCEKGDIGHAVRDWGHVRLFSSNSLNCSPAGLRALADLGLAPPDPATYPTGDELCETYLEPLAKWLAQREDCEILLGARVESITRGGLLKGEAIKAASPPRPLQPLSNPDPTAGPWPLRRPAPRREPPPPSRRYSTSTAKRR